MLSREQAKSIALAYISRKVCVPPPHKVVLVDEETEERPLGWLFFYQTEKCIETRKRSDALIGNGPILIDKRSAKIVQFGSSASTDYWYELYRTGKTREDDDGVIHLLFRQ